MKFIIIIGLLLISRCASGWYMTDTTPQFLEHREDIQFNEIKKNPPSGCNNEWWELNDSEIITWLESSKKIIYVQEFDEEGSIYWYMIKWNYY